MTTKTKSLISSDIINKDFLEYVLGLVSNYIGCATFGVTPNGETVNEVNITDFCKMVKSTELGRKACQECDTKYCEQACKTKTAQMYECPTGLHSSSVPVFDGNTYIGSIFCGQILQNEPDIEFCKQKAKEYGIDEETYMDAIKQVPVVNEEKFKEAVIHVEHFCKAISNLISSKHAEQEYKNRRTFILSLLRDINDKKDMHEIMQGITEEVAKIFDVDRVIIADFVDKKLVMDIDYFPAEKMSKEAIANIHEAESDGKVMNATVDILLERRLIANNNLNEYEIDPDLKAAYVKVGLKSALSSVITAGGREKALIIETFNNYRTWTSAEISFFNIIVEEINLALEQTKMRSDLEYQLDLEETVLNNIPFVLAMKDIDGKYLAVNNNFLEYYNFKKENVIGKTADDIFSPEIYERSKKEQEQIVKTKKGISEDFQEIHNGKMSWVRVEVSPVLDKNNKVVGFVGYKRDISDDKKMEQMKSEFISMISHELRTPLTSIISGLSLALSGKIGTIEQKTKTVLDISKNNSERLLNLINDILDIEKLSSGNMEYTYETIDLSATIEEAVKGIENFASNYNINVKFNAESCNQLLLTIDKRHFIQILTNLLSNAIKFTENQKDVEIFVNDLPNDMIRISVVNYGPEISKNFKEKIFDKFTQENSSTSRQKGGTGLGLSIVHKMVEDMRGTIDFTSKNGKTVFYVEFDKAL